MRKKIFIFVISIVFLGIGFFILPNTAVALDTGLNYVDNNIELGNEDPRVVAARIIQIFLGLLGLIALVIILYAGFLWMTSGGSEDKVSKAKKTLTNTVIGLLIILASFGITTFILSSFLDATGAGNSNNGGGGNNVNLGLGALGACSVENVYPTPGQKDVPRNTSILVSFKEPVQSESMCVDANSNGICDGGEYINSDNIEIYKTDEAVNIANVQILDTDLANPGMSFILTPEDLLGSSSEKTWYTVKLNESILKLADTISIFDSCSPQYMQWDFQVGTILDLIPPQVEVGGVFPGPDDGRDSAATTTPAVLATGSITVDDYSKLKVYVEASITSADPVVGTTVGIDSFEISPDYHQQNENFYVKAVSPVKAQLFEGAGTSTLITIANINSNSVNFPNYFSLNFDDTPQDGNLWEVSISPEVFADTLRVGDIVYSFDPNPGATKIEIGTDNDKQAEFIFNALNNNPAVLPTTTTNVVTLSAYTMGAVGNDILLSSSSNGTALSLVPMSGGVNAQTNYNIADKKDKPRNSIIQINFNEAINPALVSGDAEGVKETVRVINAEGGALSHGDGCAEDKECLSYKCDADTNKCVDNQLAGKFVLSNQFSTLEFISDNVCGVNGCGEIIYCLPGKSNLMVEIEAAVLNLCDNPADCSALDPYTSCSTFCQNAALDNYPGAKKPVASGIVDLAFNSFDGNRDDKVQGPVSYYSENVEDTDFADNYNWSFYISDYIALDPPKIKFIEPDVAVLDVALNTPIKIEFDSLMMKSSLKTGSTVIRSGNQNFTHRRVNLWGSAPYPLGYWINSEDIDLNQALNLPLDGLDETHLYINHSLFADSMSHKAEVGSGVKNIYQNCFKPSASNDCNANSSNPTCCNNVATSTSFCP